jgi:endothelin-converting enzyme
MAERSQSLLRHILETDYPKSSEHSHFSPTQLRASDKSADERNFDKMKAAYDACLNTDAIKEAGDLPLRDFLSTFDVSTGQGEIQLEGTIRWLSYHGVTGLVSLYAGADDTNPDVVVVSVGSPRSIGLPSKERYEDDVLVAKYRDVMGQVLGAFYPNEKSLAEKSDAIVAFEKKLAAASPTEEERESPIASYNPMSLADASALCPQIDLDKMVQHYAEKTGTNVDRVIVNAPSYLRNLTDIIKETDAETLQGYLSWKTIQSLSSYVEADSVKPYQRLSKELAGQDPDAVPERWRTCVRYVDGSVGWILSRFFIEKAFSSAAKDLADRVVYDIKDQFIKTLKNTAWMEKEVQDLAIKKVNNIIQKIGYPTKASIPIQISSS